MQRQRNNKKERDWGLALSIYIVSYDINNSKNAHRSYVYIYIIVVDEES